MKIVIQYVKRQLAEIENLNNANRDVQMVQLEKYLNKLRKVLSKAEYVELLSTITDSKQGANRFYTNRAYDYRANSVLVVATKNGYLKQFDYRVRLMNGDNRVLTISRNCVK